MAENKKKGKGSLKIHDWTKETDDEGFELLPVGDYPCFVFDMNAGISDNNNPKATVVLKVATGDHKGRQLWTNLTFTKKAWWKVVEFFNAVGIDLEKDLPKEVKDQYELVAAVKGDVLGTKVMARVNHRKWQGEDRENVAKVMPAKEDFSIDVEDTSPPEDAPF